MDDLHWINFVEKWFDMKLYQIIYRITIINDNHLSFHDERPLHIFLSFTIGNSEYKFVPNFIAEILLLNMPTVSIQNCC